MAVKGAIAKQEITNKIFEAFPNAFISGKEIRIPWKEDSEDVEIKVTLTAAKDLVGSNQAEIAEVTPVAAVGSTAPAAEPLIKKPSDEEKKRLSDLIRSLGL